ERLDQRVGQPLRELVQGHETVGDVVAPERGVAPAIAERDVVELQPVRPDRAERLEQSLEDGGGGEAAVHGAGGEQVVETAGVSAGEKVGPGPDLRAEAAEQGGAAMEASQRIVRRALEAAGQPLRVEAGKIVQLASFGHALAGDGEAVAAGRGAAAA